MSENRRYTIFGGNGFIAACLHELLLCSGNPVTLVTRSTWPDTGADLGNVIFTIGMTADFRDRPIETTYQQLVLLHDALTRYSFASFLYLSSTRVYKRSDSTNEAATLGIDPNDADDIYGATKIAAESLCLSIKNAHIRVARLSNVFGNNQGQHTFLGEVLKQATSQASVKFLSSPVSTKDYIHIDDASRLLLRISAKGKSRLYNVASGSNVTHREIADVLEANGVRCVFAPSGSAQMFPPVDVQRIREEFDLNPSSLLYAIPSLVEHQRKVCP